MNTCEFIKYVQQIVAADFLVLGGQQAFRQLIAGFRRFAA